MSSLLKCRLRILRRGWSLSQHDLATLLPSCGRNRIGRLERGLAEPTAAELTACGLIFGLSAHAVFPYLYEDMSETVMQRAYRLHQKYQHHTTRKAKRKLELLEQLKSRAIASTNQHHI